MRDFAASFRREFCAMGRYLLVLDVSVLSLAGIIWFRTLLCLAYEGNRRHHVLHLGRLSLVPTTSLHHLRFAFGLNFTPFCHPHIPDTRNCNRGASMSVRHAILQGVRSEHKPGRAQSRGGLPRRGWRGGHRRWYFEEAGGRWWIQQRSFPLHGPRWSR